MSAQIFRAIADMALGAKAKRMERYEAFLDFYKTLVETLPSEATAMFGRMPVSVKDRGKPPENWGIELTATDFLFWKDRLGRTVEFVKRPENVKSDMFSVLAKKAEKEPLTAEERKTLLMLLEKA